MKIISVGLLMLVCASCSQNVEIDPRVTFTSRVKGQTLTEECLKQTTAGTAVCMAYIDGVVDAVEMQKRAVDEKEKWLCKFGAEDSLSLLRTVRLYMQTEEGRNQPDAAYIVYTALDKAYGC